MESFLPENTVLRESVDKSYADKLFRKRFFERITVHSDNILEILRNDENNEIYNLVHKYIEEQGAKLSVQDLKSYLETIVYDPDGQIVTVFGVSTDPYDFTTEAVSQDTYDALKSVALDPDVIQEEVKTQIEKAAF